MTQFQSMLRRVFLKLKRKLMRKDLYAFKGYNLKTIDTDDAVELKKFSTQVPREGWEWWKELTEPLGKWLKL